MILFGSNQSWTFYRNVSLGDVNSLGVYGSQVFLASSFSVAVVDASGVVHPLSIGILGTIYCLAVDGNGNAIFGGNFQVAGTSCSTGVTIWNPNSPAVPVSTLPFISPVRACKFIKDLVWCAGQSSLGNSQNLRVFNSTHELQIQRVLPAPFIDCISHNDSGVFLGSSSGVEYIKFGENSTVQLSSINGVRHIAVLGPNIVVGGSFTSATNYATVIQCTHLCWYDGNKWIGMFGGTNGNIIGLEVIKNEICAVIDQTLVSNSDSTPIVCWNFTSNQWRSIGPFAISDQNQIYYQFVDSNYLYISGRFTLQGVQNFARMNLETEVWTALSFDPAPIVTYYMFKWNETLCLVRDLGTIEIWCAQGSTFQKVLTVNNDISGVVNYNGELMVYGSFSKLVYNGTTSCTPFWVRFHLIICLLVSHQNFFFLVFTFQCFNEFVLNDFSY